MTTGEGPRLSALRRSLAAPPSAPRPPGEPDATVVVLSGPIARADIPALCDRARVLLEGCGADLVVCDVGALDDPDAVTVDALARLQLTARRLGRGIRLSQACGELRELLALMGLKDVLPVGAVLPLEPRGQAEEREQGLGVEEEADPGDPPP
jgi:ABC-type transporter Mla MlaB component